MTVVPGVTVVGRVKAAHAAILTPEAQQHLAMLHRVFEGRRREALRARDERQARVDAGEYFAFLPETAHIRKDETWRAAPPAPGLADRRVEITGPVERKMVINALNSPATQFMADFEDSTSPTWENLLDGQVNLRDANLRTIAFTAASGKRYALKPGPLPVLLVRTRGWHLVERHFLVDGSPISGALFDFGLYFIHNVHRTLQIGQGPYFYLPKMESHLEARLWNDVFNLSQDTVQVPRGTIRATVLIETVPAAFEMDEIIYELREHSAGLNCGRWDYIFSFIKKFHAHRDFILPDRTDVTMTVPFMRAYVELLIKTCHRRGVHAMGGMAAQIPVKNDATANEQAMERVRLDKTREVLAGHDGTWVAHPDLIPIARAVFDEHMPQANQLHQRREDVHTEAAELLDAHVPGKITEKGVRENVRAALLYMDSWLGGNGCVPINNLMEDAATAEIARSQLWQWSHYNCTAADTRRPITDVLIEAIVREECAAISTGDGTRTLMRAAQVLGDMVRSERFEPFLTLLLYDDILSIGGPAATGSGSKL